MTAEEKEFGQENEGAGGDYPPVSPFRAGLKQACPRCGQGALYDGFLTVAARCPKCDLDYAKVDSGDGPAVFIILIVGFIVVFAALFVEVTFTPPYWVHMLLWTPAVLGLSIGALRPFKATLIALQYSNSAREGKLVSNLDDEENA